MAITLANNPLNTSVDAVAALFDGGSIEFKSGATVLVALTLDADVFPPASAGSTDATTTNNPTLGMPVVVSGPVTATGVCDAFSVKDSGGAAILTGNVTLIGGGGSFELSQLEMSVGDLMVVSTMTYSQPATGA